MGKFLYLLTFVMSLDPKYQEAGDQSRRALLETDLVKIELKDLEETSERELYWLTGIHKDDLAYAAYAYPLFANKISTKPFKNFKYNFKDRWSLIPELEYNLRDQNYSSQLILIKEF